MDNVTIIGLLASGFTAISLFPQLCKIMKEKKVENISLLMLISLLIGLIFWILYGVFKQDYILIVSNGFSLILNVITTVLIIQYKK